MKISEIMKTGTYIPATVTIKGKQFDAAYPFPLLHVDLDDERLEISAPLHKDAFLSSPKEEKICIPLKQIREIRCSAQKWYGGPLWKRYETDCAFRFPIIITIELTDHSVYRFRNNMLLMIYDLYRFSKESDITLIDEKQLLDMLKDVSAQQSTPNIEREIGLLLAPFAGSFELIS